ncbi:MAG: glycosyltransferase family 2 protein [Candidatus Goldbacteria bacterium]|nr:glycosyltransferase family 2 protein [Candidatus Goldiibacteriota bacterium]
MEINKISAIIVTFNRSKLLKECLYAVINQTCLPDAIYLVDNASSDDTVEMLLREGFLNTFVITDLYEHENTIIINDKRLKFFYLRLNENIGGAGGFHEGLKRAYEKGYEWFWLMDDDAEPYKDCLERVIVAAKDLDNIFAFSSLKVNTLNEVEYWHRGWIDMCSTTIGMIRYVNENDLNSNRYIKIEHSSFVGFIISRLVVEKIGLPNKDFFLHYDDFEYCLRLKNKYDICLVKESIILHKDIAKKDLIKIRKSMRKPYSALWLWYYGIRNLVYLKYRYCNFRVKIYIIFWILRKILGIIFYDDHKLRRILFYCNAYFDGVKGIFDNKKPKKILYG